jgi:cell division protein FtsQ
MTKRGKKRKRRGLRIILLLLPTMLILSLVMILYTPLFNIMHIDVSGAEFYSADEIVQASGIHPGENGYRKIRISPEAILGLRLIDAEDAIEALSYVKEAVVRLVFPNSVKITITERKPAACIVYLGSFLTIDDDGYVLEVSSNRPPEDLKEIRGVDFTKYAIGERLESDNIGYVHIADDIVKAVKRSDSNSDFLMWPMIDWIDIVNSKSALMSLDNRVLVRFDPTDNLQYTIDFAKQIFFTKISTNERGRLEFVPGLDPSFIPE